MQQSVSAPLAVVVATPKHTKWLCGKERAGHRRLPGVLLRVSCCWSHSGELLLTASSDR
jgi:hypothetical protein